MASSQVSRAMAPLLLRLRSKRISQLTSSICLVCLLLLPGAPGGRLAEASGGGRCSWLRDWRLQGHISRSGWQGTAAYSLGDAGHQLQFRAEGPAGGQVREFGTSVKYRPEAGPILELSGALRPSAEQKVSMSAALK
eukprot:TRINITY_DN24470_c0_g1_i2.p1 TRINITY_DN24470_c0_g1~~TRINITY_DN24470_c0_g1_i2.p1  ORF type:complete len:137 (-),score=21.08 TRINITY_DN24470_c0_g1_i2:425-835(-)